MGRGNRRAAIFTSDEDNAVFLMQLKKVKERYPFDLHAYCLMTNHFHLELTTKDEPIWKIMKPLMQNYAMWFNKRYGYEGHVFDSRYTSCLIEDNVYFLEVNRYIHLNPVKARMVSDPLDYKHSSYSIYLNDENKYGMGDLMEKERVLGAFPNNPRDQYRMFVEEKISHSENELLIQKDMKEDDMWLP